MDSHTMALQQSQLEKLAMRPEDVTGQIELIQAVMRRVMKEGEHYGKIPGTDKLTLLQPGAEKLILTFRLGTEFTVLKAIEEQDLISYAVRCDLFHIPTGNRVASGIGSCNSRESKYRYRYIPSDKKPAKAEADRLKALGQGRWRKVDGQWTWFERIENDNPWEYQNTILKMAAKRAKVAATLNATAASDIFTQDMEDMDLTGTDLSDKSSPKTEAAQAEVQAQPVPMAQPAPAAQVAQSMAEERAPEAKAGRKSGKGKEQKMATASTPAETPAAAQTEAPAAAETQARTEAPAATSGSIDLETLRRTVSDVTTMTRLEQLWKENAKEYEADENYKDIRRMFIEHRQFIQEAQTLERSQGHGEAA